MSMVAKLTSYESIFSGFRFLAISVLDFTPSRSQLAKPGPSRASPFWGKDG